MSLNTDNKQKYVDKYNDTLDTLNVTPVFQYLRSKATSGKEDEKAAASALLEELRSAIQTAFRLKDGSWEKDAVFNSSVQELEQKYQAFFKANGYSEIHTADGIALTETFRIVSDLLSYYKALETQQYYSDITEELDKSKIADTEIINEVNTYIAEALEVNLEIDDRLAENIDKEIEVAEHQISLDDAYFSDMHSQGIRLDTEAAQQEFVDAQIRNEEQIRQTELKIKEHEDKISVLDKETERLDKAFNAPGFNTLDSLYPQIRQNNEELQKLRQLKKPVIDELNAPDFKAASLRLSKFKLYRDIVTESKDTIEAFIMATKKLEGYKADLEKVVNSIGISKEGALQDADAPAVSKNIEKELIEKQSIYNDYSIFLENLKQDSKDVLDKIKDVNPEELLSYFEGSDSQYEKDRVLMEVGYPQKKAVLDNIDNQIKQFTDSNERITSEIRKVKTELFIEDAGMDKAELPSMTVDEIKERISSAKDAVEKKKDALKQDKNYQELLTTRDKLKGYMTSATAIKLVDKYKATLERNTANKERLGKLKALKEKRKGIDKKVADNNNRKSLTATKAENLSSKDIENEILSQLSNYEANIETLSRKDTHYNFDNENDPKNTDFIKNNSKEFVSLRKIIHETQKTFADANKSTDEKIAAMMALQTSASDYMKARKAETRPFQSSTRKFRMAYVNGIIAFSTNAIERLNIKVPETQEKITDAFRDNPDKRKNVNDYIRIQKDKIIEDYKNKQIEQKQGIKQDEKAIERHDEIIEERKLESVIKILADDKEKDFIEQEDKDYAESLVNAPEDSPFKEEPDMFDFVYDKDELAEYQRREAEDEARRKEEHETNIREARENVYNPQHKEEKKYLSKQAVLDELNVRMNDKLRYIFGVKEKESLADHINSCTISKDEHGHLYLLKDIPPKVQGCNIYDLAEYLYYRNTIATIENNPKYPEKSLQTALYHTSRIDGQNRILASPDFRHTIENMKDIKWPFDEFTAKLSDPIFRRTNKLNMSTFSCKLEIQDRMGKLLPDERVYIGEEPKGYNKQTAELKFLSEKDFKKYIVYSIILKQANEFGEEKLNVMLNSGYVDRMTNQLDQIGKYSAMYEKLHNISYMLPLNKGELDRMVDSFIDSEVVMAEKDGISKDNQPIKPEKVDEVNKVDQQKYNFTL